MKDKPLRKVIEASFYRVRCRLGYGSYMLTLECGHKEGRKQSEVKNLRVGETRIRCLQCAGKVARVTRVK